MSNPIERLGKATSRVAAAVMPDPFVLAILLTVVTLFVSLAVGKDVSTLAWDMRIKTVVVDGWFAGLTGAGGIAFAFQMILVLITGHALALSKPVRRLIDLLASIPRSPSQAAVMVALVACLAGIIHWGLGAVAGAMLAREIGRSWKENGRKLHYPLLGAAAYSGLLVWHGGLSGSAPLKVAEPGHFLEKVSGVIPVTETLGSTLNFTITGLMVLTVVGAYALLMPKGDNVVEFSEPAPTERSGEDPQAEGSSAFVRFLETSPLASLLLVTLGFAYLVYSAADKGMGALNLNTVNLGFLILGLLLHGSPKSYLEAAADGAKGTLGIVLQFPLYFGILGILKASGLIVQISDAVVQSANGTTLPIFTFLSAGVVNFFVPSGGGQWAVQGPVMMKAANDLGVTPAKVVMALAYGDAWTNMLQPFWALPLLGIMRLRARDIVGYTTLICLISGPVIVVGLLVM